MSQVNDKVVENYWNDRLTGEELKFYSAGYVLPAQYERVARYRFEREVDFLEKHFEFGGNYLDLGCGTGTFIQSWHDKFTLLVGLDFSAHLLRLAKRYNNQYNNVSLIQDNGLNFEVHTGQMSFHSIFVGGCLMYLNDSEAVRLLAAALTRLEAKGVLIFREPTAKSQFTDQDGAAVRRTIGDYKKLVELTGQPVAIERFENYAVYYAHLIMIYIRYFPFLKQRTHWFENKIVTFLFLFIPARIYLGLGLNSISFNFFVIRKRL
jgi:SAM-dependent methyltransferase